MIARVLLIAGSDSGGGAGIQADLKTATMLGGHGLTVLTAITAQHSQGVTAVHPVPLPVVRAQLDAVISDFGVDAIKVGMVASPAMVDLLVEVLAPLAARGVPVVIDPVMVAASGARLIDDATIDALPRLLALARVVTPNRDELALLGGEAAVLATLADGAALLAKGGSDGDPIVDRLVDRAGELGRWSAPPIVTRHTHGTGCTLASAIATGLGQGRALADAVAQARTFVRIALHAAPGLGHGHGPLGHADVRQDVGPGPRLNQVTVPCQDYEASVAFYRRLGLRLLVASPPRYARFETAGGATLSIEVATDATDATAGPGITVYLESDDLDAWVAALTATGLAFEHPPVDQPWRWREARLRDPAGNRLCLYQAGELRRFPPWRHTAD